MTVFDAQRQKHLTLERRHSAEASSAPGQWELAPDGRRRCTSGLAREPGHPDILDLDIFLDAVIATLAAVTGVLDVRMQFQPRRS